MPRLTIDAYCKKVEIAPTGMRDLLSVEVEDIDIEVSDFMEAADHDEVLNEIDENYIAEYLREKGWKVSD